MEFEQSPLGCLGAHLECAPSCFKNLDPRGLLLDNIACEMERLTAILSYLRRADLRITVPSVSLSDLLRNRTSSFSNTYLVIVFLL